MRLTMPTRRSDVLAALREAGSAGVSGEAVAARLGVSRVAVRKHVVALCAAGYEIEAVPGSGYRLLAVPDLPLPDEVAPLLEDPARWGLRGGGPTGSTNDDAKVLARAGAHDGTVVLASEQTGGRGRLGRTWSSPLGGVYLSAVLRPPLAVHESPPLALACALGVALGLERLGAAPALKWPNDVLLGEGKLAGLLLEVSAESDALEWAVVGAGINVRPPVGGAREPGAAYLADALDPAPRLGAVAAAVLDGIAEACAPLEAGEGFAPVRDAYSRRLATAGADVAVRDRAGAVVAEGVARGVDEWGRLLVEGAQGVTAIVAGEVTLRA
ncbi:MAG: biotin--[acetyl-CoA-carboxylase] ligase [Actinobacteria bacterium]|nr:MAG: biotin--[acetyl-CoA-carboxylase] ligase [Actinomycetota bacterium]